MSLSNKISNILGTKLPNWLIDQLVRRANEGGQSVRDNDNILFLANKTAWVRLVSSIDIVNPSDISYFQNALGPTITNAEDLAKQFVLFGGTSKYLNQNSYQQRAGLGQGGSYGTLGSDEVKQFGFRPMPGITSVTIDTQGTLGSLRLATVSFKCWDKVQLDIIDALYFKLGFTMFLEWGQTFFYPNNSTKIKSSELYSIDPFRKDLTKEEIALQITKNILESEGNYDAMLGMVTNFNFSYNQEGGYDCILKIMGLGILGDSIKINNPTALPTILAEEIKALSDTLLSLASQQVRDQQALAKAEEEERRRREQEKSLSSEDFIKKYIKYNPANQQISGGPSAYASNVPKKFELADLSFNTEAYGRVTVIRRLNGFITEKEDLLRSVKIKLDSDRIISLINQTGLNLKSTSSDAWGSLDSVLRVAIPDRGELQKVRSTWNWNSKTNGINYELSIARSAWAKTTDPTATQKEFPIFVDEFADQFINVIKTDNDFKIIKVEQPTVNKFSYTLKISIPFTRTIKKQPPAQINPDGTKTFPPLIDSSELLSVETEFTFEDSSFIKSFTTSADVIQPKDFIGNLVNQNQNQTPTAEEQSLPQQPSITQIKQALQYQSGLELTLRTIQVHALNRALTLGSDIGKKVYQLKMKDNTDVIGGKFFYQQIFSNGIFSSFIDQLINNNISDTDDLLKVQSNYGFATEFMAGRVSVKEMNDNKVDFNELLSAYVVPYEVNQEIISGINTNHPVYITLGLLLMILNNSCTIYDTKNVDRQTPLVYLDFNTSLNFFLSNTKHLSTNPFKVLIPFEGSFSDYQELFPTEILSDDRTKILPLSGSTEYVPLFDKGKEDRLSPQIPKIKFDNTDNNVYRGRLMNVLLNIDYVVEIIKDNSLKDGSNNVYLKPFLEQLLLDINKYLGDFSALRLAYNDGANTFHIVDDQVAPPAPGDKILEPNNTTEIPLVGRFGLAKNLEIKTEVSSKLSSMIAISANADVKDKATLSTNGDNFGFINTSYRDRYVPVKGDLTGSGKPINQDTIKSTAGQFNQTISDFYSTINPSEANVSQATNYYIERMSRIKNKEYPTRASTMIPVSVNFSIDGIAGLTMGQAFSISDQLLPYTYNNRIVQSEPGLGRDHINKVGFAIVGLTNTIENNQWNTSVKANMIFLKRVDEFKGSVTKLVNTGAEFTVNPNNIVVTNPVQVPTGPINLPDSIKNSSEFRSFIAIPGVEQRVQQIATKLGVKPEDLYFVFYQESKFRYEIQNRDSKAVGLIQFIPSTAAILGTTTEQLKTMGAVKQLDYVEKYFGNRKFKNAYDLYLFVFFPLGLGKPSSFVLQNKNQSAQLISTQNKGIAIAAGKKPGDPLTVNDFYIYVKNSLTG